MNEAFLFYLISAVLIGSAFKVVFSRNPVHSVLYLILAFFNSAALFIMLGAEFLAMILLIVYVGAVAVLFMFVVMMLNINFAEFKEKSKRYLPLGAIIGLVLLAELGLVVNAYMLEVPTVTALSDLAMSAFPRITNTEAIGQVLYTDYVYIFQAAGMILLVAMIGAIVLTHRVRTGVKRQKVSEQLKRSSKETVELKKVPPGQGT